MAFGCERTLLSIIIIRHHIPNTRRNAAEGTRGSVPCRDQHIDLRSDASIVSLVRYLQEFCNSKIG